MKIKNIISAIVLLSFFCSCSVSKKRNQVSEKQIQETIQQNQETVSYHNFNAQYKGSYNSIPFKVQLRGTHDSLIWCSVTTFIGEIGRAQISSDSVYLMDKINSNAYIISKNTIKNLAGKDLNNKELEKLITDTANAELQLELTKPFVISVLMKKQVTDTEQPYFDIEAQEGKRKHKFRLIQNSISFDNPQQYPFKIPEKYTIKRK